MYSVPLGWGQTVGYHFDPSMVLSFKATSGGIVAERVSRCCGDSSLFSPLPTRYSLKEGQNAAKCVRYLLKQPLKPHVNTEGNAVVFSSLPKTANKLTAVCHACDEVIKTFHDVEVAVLPSHPSQLPTDQNVTQKLEAAQSLRKKMSEQTDPDIKGGFFKATLSHYKDAFQFTSCSESYADFPSVFLEMQQPRQALVAFLHLALYQIKEGKNEEVLTTLSRIRSLQETMDLPQLAKVQIFEAEYLSYRGEKFGETDSMDQAFKLFAELASKAPVNGGRKLALWQKALECTQRKREAYEQMILNFNYPDDRGHIAIVAFLETGDPVFCDAALSNNKDPALIKCLMLSKAQKSDRREAQRTLAETLWNTGYRKEALVYFQKAAKALYKGEKLLNEQEHKGALELCISHYLEENVQTKEPYRSGLFELYRQLICQYMGEITTGKTSKKDVNRIIEEARKVLNLDPQCEGDTAFANTLNTWTKQLEAVVEAAIDPTSMQKENARLYTLIYQESLTAKTEADFKKILDAYRQIQGTSFHGFGQQEIINLMMLNHIAQTNWEKFSRGTPASRNIFSVLLGKQ